MVNQIPFPLPVSYRIINGIIRLTKGINRLIDGITSLIHGITRLVNGWGAGRRLPPEPSPHRRAAAPGLRPGPPATQPGKSWEKKSWKTYCHLEAIFMVK